MNDQANMYRQMAYQSGLPREKDPTVATADDAIAALKKRAAEIRRELDKVEGWKFELAQIERMVAASENKAP